MKERRFLELGVEHPRAVLAAVGLITLAFLIQFPKAVIDTDPENMLESDQADRAFYAQMKEDFGIYDLIVAGVEDPDGIFSSETLGRLDRIADGILAIDGVIVEDVLSLSTTDTVTSQGGLVDVGLIMDAPPGTPAEVAAIRAAVYDNPMLVEQLVSLDGTAAAFYVPITQKDESHRIAREIQAVMDRELSEAQRSYIAGLPVAEDTFGFEMFLQMGVMAPLAMLVIFAVLFAMFRSLAMVVPPLVVALLSVIWGMGALIGAGFTVHIMSSMIPIFLMPIAVLDSVHVLSEFHDLSRAGESRANTLRRVLRELFTPMLFTSLTSAAGFASLALAPIPPVRVFGLFVAFGILAAWVLTLAVVPACLMLASGPTRALAADDEDSAARWGVWLGRVTEARGRAVVVAATVLLAIGGLGLSRIVVNDNPVKWFKPSHEIRVADEAMNRLFGGTYMADVVLDGEEPDTMKRPDVLRFVDALQTHLEADPLVGKTASIADVVRRVRHVMLDGDPSADAIPETREEVAQFLFLFLMSGDPNDLDNFVDYDYRRGNIWVQLREGDNQDVAALEASVADFVRTNPVPAGVSLRWSGLTYINKVWQDLMVVGMRDALAGGFLTVFLLMWLLFRSFGLALVSMVPLTFAIAVAYGLVGWVGKDYDMPIAVCSSLALGLSVDFAIHFVQRYRHQWTRLGDARQVASYMFGAPGRAIVRNAVVIVVGFLPLVLATLTPYVTVGAFFAMLMTVSAATTLLLLPVLMRRLAPRLC